MKGFSLQKSALARRRLWVASHCLTLRSKGRCAIKLRSAPELGRWASYSATVGHRSTDHQFSTNFPERIMKSNSIPPAIQELAQEIVENFNRIVLKKSINYLPRFKGAFLYLDRKDYGGAPTEICRLKYAGSIEKWEFAIFKHSSNRYDPEEFMFPGAALLNGTIEGAMLCGMEAYPA